MLLSHVYIWEQVDTDYPTNQFVCDFCLDKFKPDYYTFISTFNIDINEDKNKLSCSVCNAVIAPNPSPEPLVPPGYRLPDVVPGSRIGMLIREWVLTSLKPHFRSFGTSWFVDVYVGPRFLGLMLYQRVHNCGAEPFIDLLNLTGENLDVVVGRCKACGVVYETSGSYHIVPYDTRDPEQLLDRVKQVVLDYIDAG
jgi:hypothetical protein